MKALADKVHKQAQSTIHNIATLYISHNHPDISSSELFDVYFVSQYLHSVIPTFASFVYLVYSSILCNCFSESVCYEMPPF